MLYLFRKIMTRVSFIDMVDQIWKVLGNFRVPFYVFTHINLFLGDLTLTMFRRRHKITLSILTEI